MKSKTYLAINLNDFHENQNKTKGETFTKIVFINANSIDEAKQCINNRNTDNAWTIIPKDYFDKNIAYKQ